MIQDPFPSVANNTYYETYYAAVNAGQLTIFTINAIGLVGHDAATTTPCRERFRLLIEKQDEPGGQWVFYSETWLQLVGTELIGAYILNESGNYRFTVSVLNKCVRTDYVYTGISVSDCDGSLSIELADKQDSNCFGANNGIIDTTTSGGVPPYTYLWNNGATTPYLNPIGPGTYQVVVTDANGCDASLPDPVIITEPDQIQVGFNTSITEGECNGVIEVIVTGGTAPYTYRFQDSGSVVLYDGPNNTLTGLCAGTYYVFVLDANGCGATRTISLPSI